ncbi:hypothetical protein [Bacillus subtilis]|uniref:hypothetical protein n=2 Tax=Bacillus subtilis TaxID=1423 RepID=UPI0005ADBEE6|nr:hypothetical protein [Bacillus subtilis]KIN27497.1 hypothetical protein B4069_2048 [Bacillus subtilis]KIN44628.1 hypothetical protein B4072_2143 [Bacillus subtilis]
MTTYESKPVAKWNTRDFIGYLHAKHKETYGIPYVTNNRGMEAKNLKLMIDEQRAERNEGVDNTWF